MHFDKYKDYRNITSILKLFATKINQMIYSTKYQKELKIMVLRYLVRVRTTTDKVLEALRNLPYKMYNDEAELSLELSQ